MKKLEDDFWIKTLTNQLRDIPDYPFKGYLFKDISGIFKNPLYFYKAVTLLTEKILKEINHYPDIVVGLEPNGFILGSQIARNLSAGFIPMRKKGKLPPQITFSIDYSSTFEDGSLEIYQNAFKRKQKVLIIDDILASGGLVDAASNLIERMNAYVIGWAFLIELTSMMGSDVKPVCSLIKF